MPETQETVYRWISETFPGADPGSSRSVVRVLEEMAELCRAAGISQAELIQATEKAYQGMTLHESRPEPDNVPDESADVLILLYNVAGLRGFDLHGAVDRKMGVNRVRRWNARGDGTGYHIKEGVLS